MDSIVKGSFATIGGEDSDYPSIGHIKKTGNDCGWSHFGVIYIYICPNISLFVWFVYF